MTEASPPRRRRILRTLFITGFLLAPVAVFFHFRDDSEPPANPYAAYLPTPDSEGERRFAEAARAFMEATAGFDKNTSDFDTYDTQFSEERLAFEGFSPARQIIDARADHLPAAEVFLNRRPIRFKRPSSDALNRKIDEVVALKRAWKTLAAAATKLTAEGKPAEAVELLTRHADSIRHSDGCHHTLITALTQVACAGLLDRTLTEIAWRTTDRATIEHALRTARRNDPDRELAWRTTLAGELEFFKLAFHQLRNASSPRLPHTASGWPKVDSPRAVANWARDYWMSANTLPNATARVYFDAASAQEKGAPPAAPGFFATTLGRNCGGIRLVTVAQFGLSIRSRFVEGFTANRRLTQAAIAIRLHEVAHGRRPASLAELSPDILPAVPLDPYDGKPLRYDAKRGILWSVGANRIDDLGDEDKDIRLWLPGCEPPDAVSVFDQEKKRKAAEAAAP